jgi:hypothetical protein
MKDFTVGKLEDGLPMFTVKTESVGPYAWFFFVYITVKDDAGESKLHEVMEGSLHHSGVMDIDVGGPFYFASFKDLEDHNKLFRALYKKGYKAMWDDLQLGPPFEDCVCA